VLAETTADLTWTLLMTYARRTVERHEYVEADKWKTSEPRFLTGADIYGATLGIVSLGDIGTSVARRTAGFDMDVLYADRGQKPDTEDELTTADIDTTHVDQLELLVESDFMSLYTPLTEDTHHFVGENELRRM
jgi:glyoxylate reductase